MKTILVVDDVETDRLLVGRVVESTGHQAIYAANGKEAEAKARAASPSLILMDVVMPEQDGFKTTRALKSRPETASIPIVLVTTKSTESDRFWGKRQGADDHLAKPFTPEMLLSVIRRYA